MCVCVCVCVCVLEQVRTLEQRELREHMAVALSLRSMVDTVVARTSAAASGSDCVEHRVCSTVADRLGVGEYLPSFLLNRSSFVCYFLFVLTSFCF